MYVLKENRRPVEPLAASSTWALFANGAFPARPAPALTPVTSGAWQHRSSARAKIRELLRDEAFSGPAAVIARLRILHPGLSWPKDLGRIVQVEALILQLAKLGVTANASRA
jgi:hypothetical protein